MNTLIVEDDHYKLGQIRVFLLGTFSNIALHEARSVASGKACLRERAFDLILLDMSLPSYDIDIDEHEPGGTPQIFGGRELIGYVHFRNIATPVVIVTQFERFWTGTREIDIKSLGESMRSEFPLNFLGVVYFSTVSDSWKSELQKIINNLEVSI